MEYWSFFAFKVFLFCALSSCFFFRAWGYRRLFSARPPLFRVSSFLYFKVIFRDCVCVWRHFEIDLLLILNENVEYIKLVTSITFDLGWSSVVATLICSLLAKLMFRLSPIPVFDGKKQNRKKAGEKSQKSDSSNDTHTHTRPRIEKTWAAKTGLFAFFLWPVSLSSS